MILNKVIILFLTIYIVEACNTLNQNAEPRRSRSGFGTCQGRCFERNNRNQTCQCNTACLNHNDCCDDFQDLCQTQQRGQSSCEGKCFERFDRKKSCQCNAGCDNFQNCCSDFKTVCARNDTSNQELRNISNELFQLAKQNQINIQLGKFLKELLFLIMFIINLS